MHVPTDLADRFHRLFGGLTVTRDRASQIARWFTATLDTPAPVAPSPPSYPPGTVLLAGRPDTAYPSLEAAEAVAGELEPIETRGGVMVYRRKVTP